MLIERIEDEAVKPLIVLERRNKAFFRYRSKVKLYLRANYLIVESLSNSTKKVNIHRQRKEFNLKDSKFINLEGSIVEQDGVNLSVSYRSQSSFKKAQFVCDTTEAAQQWCRALCKESYAAYPSLEDFEALYVLGRGHFGKVTLVQHKESKIVLALKEIREEKRRSKSKSDKKRRRRKTISELRLEKQISERILLAKVNSPFISKLAFAFRNKGKIYFANEFAARGDLWSLIRSKKRLNVISTRYLIAELVCGIQSLHDYGIVHRDLKLENLMLDNTGHLKIIDLGLAKELTLRSSSSHGKKKYGFTFSTVGTSYYQAPEVLRGIGHDLRSDYWQIGCLVYELLVGTPAFYDRNSRKVGDLVLSGNGPDMAALKHYVVNGKEYDDIVDLLERILTQVPSDRVSLNGIKEHVFFESFDWKLVQNKQLEVPTEIGEYIGIGTNTELIDRETIATYFKEAKSVSTGEKLNSRMEITSSVARRKKVVNGKDSTSSSGSSASTSTSSSSDAEEASDLGCPKHPKRREPMMPTRQDSVGPLLGFNFKTTAESLQEIAHDFVVL